MTEATMQSNVITMEDWRKFGAWENVIVGKALPVQVSEDIYNEFLGCIPPAEMGITRSAFLNVPLPVQSYFLVGEASYHINGFAQYACFVKAFDTRYFFIGYISTLNDNS